MTSRLEFEGSAKHKWLFFKSMLSYLGSTRAGELGKDVLFFSKSFSRADLSVLRSENITQ